MNNLVTKSILTKPSKLDGLRICVMRRIKPEYKFDVWLPKLAPSEKLLKAYVVDKIMSWRAFSAEYDKKVLKKNKKLIDFLKDLAKQQKITLLCWEKSEKRCHRSLLLKEIKKNA